MQQLRQVMGMFVVLDVLPCQFQDSGIDVVSTDAVHFLVHEMQKQQPESPRSA